MKKNLKQKRIDNVNNLLTMIANCGRKFFLHKQNIAKFELDSRGRVWFIDEYTRERIYTHYIGKWQGFSHGETLKTLIIAFRDYICTGKQVEYQFGPFQKWYSNGDPWGYGNDMKQVRKAAANLGIIVEK